MEGFPFTAVTGFKSLTLVSHSLQQLKNFTYRLNTGAIALVVKARSATYPRIFNLGDFVFWHLLHVLLIYIFQNFIYRRNSMRKIGLAWSEGCRHCLWSSEHRFEVHHTIRKIQKFWIWQEKIEGMTPSRVEQDWKLTHGTLSHNAEMLHQYPSIIVVSQHFCIQLQDHYSQSPWTVHYRGCG